MKNLKKAAALAVSIAIITTGGSAVYADAAVQKETLPPVPTQWEIDWGLKACAAEPVALKLDENIIGNEETVCPPVIIRDRTLVPARALFEAMGGSVGWKQTGDGANPVQTVTITMNDRRVELTIKGTTAVVNGEPKPLEVPALIIDHDGDGYGSTMLPVRFITENLGCEIEWVNETRTVWVHSPKTEEQPNRGDREDQDNEDKPSGIHNSELGYLNPAAADKLIAIDPGHGGKDPGSIGHENKVDELYEKTLNLKIALKIKEYIEAAGGQVYMLRDDDTYSKPADRGYAANDAGADLYVSIHNNSSEYSSINGTLVMYYDKINEEGKSLYDIYGISSRTVAAAVQKELLSALGRADKGIKSEPAMAVLNKTVMPAIIVEGAFLSNEEEFQIMKKDPYAEAYAQAVAKALIEVLNGAYPEE